MPRNSQRWSAASVTSPGGYSGNVPATIIGPSARQVAGTAADEAAQKHTGCEREPDRDRGGPRRDSRFCRHRDHDEDEGESDQRLDEQDLQPATRQQQRRRDPPTVLHALAGRLQFPN